MTFDHIKNVPYDPNKADRWDMLALLMAEERYPNCNILIRNKHGIGVCGRHVSRDAPRIVLDFLL